MPDDPSNFCNEDWKAGTIGLRPECTTFYLTSNAQYPAALSGAISAISSLLVMLVVFRALRMGNFTSVYHRIIMSMALFDFISSISISFTTIPMPRDVIYPFDGGSYGNVESCEAQGFGFVIGCTGSFIAGCGLHLFYVSMIHFQMGDRNIRKYLEPLIQGFAWIASLSVAITLLNLDLYNPGVYDAWCTVTVYPTGCNYREDVECIRGKQISGDFYRLLLTFFIFLTSYGCLSIILAMAMIIHGSWKSDSFFSPSPNENSALNRQQSDRMLAWREMRKVLISQAAMYVSAFILTYIFALIGLLVRNNIIDALYCTFFPLQGFFNALIFICHKVHNIRRSDPSIPISEALGFIFLNPQDAPEMRISGISLVSVRDGYDGVMDDDMSKSSVDVSDVSKDVQLSKFSVSEEMSYMFDCNVRITNNILNKDINCKERSSQETATKDLSSDNCDGDGDGKLSFSLNNDLSLRIKDNLSSSIKDDLSSASKLGDSSRLSYNLSYSVNDSFSPSSLNDASTVKASSRFRNI